MADIRIRSLTLGDRAAVRRIVRATWGRDDYIPRVFTAWVRDGGFFGAELDGRLVGFGKLTRMSPSEAFLEGMRVAPEARERGVGTALVAHRLERARRDGTRVVRFVTWSENRPMHRMARRFAFHRVSEDDWLRARPKTGPELRAGTPADLPALHALAEASGGLFREDHYASRFRRLTRADIVAAVAEQRCLVLDGRQWPRAFAILGPERARTVYLAAARGALGEFARRYRTFARKRARVRVFLALPRRKRGLIAGQGYRKSGVGYGVVYEISLPLSPALDVSPSRSRDRPDSARRRDPRASAPSRRAPLSGRARSREAPPAAGRPSTRRDSGS